MNKDNKQLILNILSSALAFFVNTGIQFVITPIITRNIGDEAYGFITLANDFVSYASIFAVVLNSVAGRFISIEIHKGNHKKAEEYYSSIFVGNIIISLVLSGLGLIVAGSFQNFLNVSDYLIRDVRILFVVTFANYILSVMISIFTVSTFVKNRIDINGIRNIISYLIKLLIVILLFGLLPDIKVYFLSIATLISTVFLGVANSRISKKIMPEIRIRLTQFKPRLVVELLKTGAWMTINNLSNVLANNFTTLLLNINVGASMAGFFSAARTISNCANGFVYAIYNVFVPTYMKLYAEDKIEELKDYSIKSMKIMTFLLSVPLIVICLKAFSFLKLWQNYRSVEEIIKMSYIMIPSVVLVIIYTPVLPLSQLGLTANKIGVQMINNIIVSVASLLSVFVVLKCTSWGLTGIAISATVIQGLKWLFFTPIYAAVVIKAPTLMFFYQNIKIVFFEVITSMVLLCVSYTLPTNGWLSLIISITFLCILGYGILFCIMFDKREKAYFINKFLTAANRIVKNCK